MDDERDLWAKLDELGEDEVRARMASGVYGNRNRPHVQAWLDRQASIRSASARSEDLALNRSAIDEARTANKLSGEANSIAREALDSARTANLQAKAANRIAIVAVAIAAVSIVTSIISASS